jgi:iron complex outermembrane receptor protein
MVPAGNFANAMFMNAGAFSTKGAELGLNWDVIRNPKQGELNWSLGYNIAFNRLKITDYPALASNGRCQLTRGGGGFPLSIFEVGYAPYTYYVFKQVYDTNGKPLEGIFADRNGNGKLDNGDKYYCHSPNPDAIMGLSTNLSYKNFDYSMAWRASIGNYIYNYMKAMNSYRTQLNPSGVSLYNIVSTEYSTPDDNKCITDEWIENGSFLKWDNATLGYNIKQIAVGVDLRIYFSVQNILTITKADVNDPEVSIGGDMSGVVRNLYPRPRTFLLGFNLNF